MPPGCTLPNPETSPFAYMFAVNPWPAALIIVALIIVVGLIMIMLFS